MEDSSRQTPSKIDPSKLESISQVLSTRAREQPDQVVFGWIRDGLDLASTQTFLQLETQARRVAGALLSAGCQKGDRVLLLFGKGPEFITSFFACLYAGAVAVPICPPRPGQKLDYFEHIVGNACPKYALTNVPQFLNAPDRCAVPGPQWLNFDEASHAREPAPLLAADNELAFLQYTSGSVSQPKGVMVSQANLMANFQMIAGNFEIHEGIVAFEWLPHYHDMGLIGAQLLHVYAGTKSYHIAPASFLQRPSRWLAGITRYRANFVGSPNFGYEHCIKHVRQDQMNDLDLSQLRTAYCGAEPIREDTLRRFTDKFAGVGFRFEAFHPCYGMAESTLLTAGTKVGNPVVRSFSASALDRRRAVPAEPDDKDARSLVSSGRPQPPSGLVIVNSENGQALAPGEVGEIWIKGPHITLGYFQQPAATQAVFGAGVEGGPRDYLRTGDLGFSFETELFVTGRLKDVIIIDGRNLYPHDIEGSVEAAHAAVRNGRVVAFSVDSGGAEQLVVVLEVVRTWWGRLGLENPALDPAETEAGVERRRLLDAVRGAVTNDHAVALSKLVICPAGGIPVTSSGKLKRRACRLLYIDSKLPGLALG